MNTSQQPHTQSTSPLPAFGGPGMGSVGPDRRYIPTPAEKSALNRANSAFLIPYVSGIVIGVSLGAAYARYKKSWNGFAFLAFGIGGEFAGRKVGEYRAKQILGQLLPSDSHLREVLQEKTSGFSLPKTQIAKPEYGLEGSIQSIPEDPDARIPPPTYRTARVPSPVTPSFESGSSVGGIQEEGQQRGGMSVWETIRRQNQQGGSVWDRIRSGGGNVTVDSAESDSRGSGEDVYQNAKSDLGMSSGGGQLGWVPRTREEEEEAAKRGVVKRNRYGDIV
ncbi:hypothetical protein HDV05_001602 [Chytridiales sp. JEL 0842]|nr:hypothetical protein HDV05_001602 [Chytridiales sp. JEL 0842]